MHRLTFAGGVYDRTQALVDGTVKPEGLRLNWLVLPYTEIWRRMLQHHEFDASELSLSSYIIARSLQKPLIAIPVFPARAFRHSYIFVNAKAQIMEPADLAGKKVGLPDFQQTATVWMRGMLQHEYGVDLQKIEWFTWGEGGRVHMDLPKRYKVRQIPLGKEPDAMLLSEELDAIMHAALLPSLLRSSNARRLFENYKQVEIEYFKKTSIFPIMHTVVMREDLWKKSPWMAVSLYKAFQEAKKLAYQKLNDTNAYKISLVWFRDPLEEQKSILGVNPWPYGLAANRNVLETLIGYLHEQGLISRKLRVEELFAQNTLELEDD